MQKISELRPIKIYAQGRALLAATRDAIAPALEKFQKSDRGLTKLVRQRDALDEEILNLESDVDGSDAAAVSALATKREQVRLLTARITALEEQSGPALEELRQALVPLRMDVLRTALAPFFNGLFDEIRAALLPIYGSNTGANHAAQASPKYGSAQQFFLGRGWGSGGVGEALEALEILDALLAGKNPWTWPVEELEPIESLLAEK